LNVLSQWLPHFELLAVRLSGSGPHRITDPEVCDLIVANRILAGQMRYVDPFRPIPGPCGHPLSYEAFREAALRQPKPDKARDALFALIDRKIARLETLAEERERDGCIWAAEIQEAESLALFDSTTEGERFRKYQAKLNRDFEKTLDTLRKLQRQGAKPGLGRAIEARKSASEPIFAVPKLEEMEMVGGLGQIEETAASEAIQPDPTIENGASEAILVAVEPETPAPTEEPTPENGASEPNLEVKPAANRRTRRARDAKKRKRMLQKAARKVQANR
jgi:hypothetical protein